MSGGSPAPGIRAKGVGGKLVKNLLTVWSVMCLPWRRPKQDFLHLCTLQMGNAAGQVRAGWSAGPESSLLKALAGEKSRLGFLYITRELVICLGHLICTMGITLPSGGAVGIACLGRGSLVLEKTKPSRPILSLLTRNAAQKIMSSWLPSSEPSL